MEDRVMKKTVDSDTSSSGWSSQHEGMKGHVQHKFCSNFTALAVSLFVGGVILGFLLPSSDNLHGPYRKVSSILGWTYFLSWSLSFYPQIRLNYQRKTTRGLSFDFQLYNLLAFSCYSAFTCSMLWWEAARSAYRERHNGNNVQVDLNDAIFALHATGATAVTVAQVMYYDWRNRTNRPSFTAVLLCMGTLVALSVYAMIVAIEFAAGKVANISEEEEEDQNYGSEVTGLNWLDFLYVLSYVKLGISLIKYFPQVFLNMRRRSTTGWNVWNVILDLTGGILSVLQLVLDCYNVGDWSGILGYPVKFGLGFVSVFFDLIFLAQHYLIYPEGKSHRYGGVCRPLLGEYQEDDNMEDGKSESSGPADAYAIRPSMLGRDLNYGDFGLSPPPPSRRIAYPTSNG